MSVRQKTRALGDIRQAVNALRRYKCGSGRQRHAMARWPQVPGEKTSMVGQAAWARG